MHEFSGLGLIPDIKGVVGSVALKQLHLRLNLRLGGAGNHVLCESTSHLAFGCRESELVMEVVERFMNVWHLKLKAVCVQGTSEQCFV